jgi:hypothetical protein
MVLTVLEAHVPVERSSILQEGYRSLGIQAKPPGLVSSQLIRSVADATLWRIETAWRDRAALDAMRAHGTPAGVVLFRNVGAEPSLAVFEVVAQLTGTEA